MSVKSSVVGKCVLCGEEVYSSERSIKSEEGLCHQRCLYGSTGAAEA